MTRFVSKLAYVDAVLFEEDRSNEDVVLDFGEGTLSVDENNDIVVSTNNGDVVLEPGHWLIKGVSDFYPCDPVTFAARWQESVPVAAEYRANPDARANAIQYLGEENLEAVQDFCGDDIEVSEDGIVWVNTNQGMTLLDRTNWVVNGPTGLFVSDPVGFMIRWIPVE